MPTIDLSLINMFFIYALLGYIWECFYLSLENTILASNISLKDCIHLKEKETRQVIKKELIENKQIITNRGYVRGFCPIYGCAAFLMLALLEPSSDNMFFLFLSGMILATSLELVVGLTLDRFDIHLWEYNYPLSYKKIISVPSSLFWGVLTILLFRVINVRIEQLVQVVPTSISTFFTIAVLLYYGLFFIRNSISYMKKNEDSQPFWKIILK